MRHAKHTFKIGRTGSHRRSMLANMLKSLIHEERIETSITKAKELRRYADRMITLAKKNTLASRRVAIQRLNIRFNRLTPKQQRKVKKDNDTSSYNVDRLILQKLFDSLGKRFASREGGYTRIIRTGFNKGDHSPQCLIEFVE